MYLQLDSMSHCLNTNFDLLLSDSSLSQLSSQWLHNFQLHNDHNFQLHNDSTTFNFTMTPQLSFNFTMTPQLSFNFTMTPQLSFNFTMTPQLSFNFTMTPQLSFNRSLYCKLKQYLYSLICNQTLLSYAHSFMSLLSPKLLCTATHQLSDNRSEWRSMIPLAIYKPTTQLLKYFPTSRGTQTESVFRNWA